MQKENLDNLWYKDSIIYQLHVKSFFDSNGDGVGDFKGLTQKLDYLVELGVNTVWILPFFPSPLKDDGYDIADYLNINPTYGTFHDFENFLNAAHERNLRVIIELVINHTSDKHEWFQRARNAPKGSKERNFYMWSDSDEKYKNTRIIFKDFETSNWTWDNVAQQYYWHRFYHHQPDLNYESLEVQDEILKIADFWFNLGVDGMRLDAIPYLYAKEGTNSENLPETHVYLKKLRKHIDDNHPGKMLLAEANQWPEDVIEYFGDGDECHMAFNFPVMPRMYMSIKMEDSFPLIDIINQTPKIPDNCQWAIFLRNHDELTLEMVTDEERDYMYKVFANDTKARINLGIRRRLAPLIDNNRSQIELLNIMLFSLPGSPILYYGDEIGMGDNYYLGDRNGVRTPMQWNANKNAGFSSADPESLFLPTISNHEYHYETINVEKQENKSGSLLHFTRMIIALRKKYKAFSRGTFDFIQTSNSKVLVYLRKYEEENILVVVNLSRYAQTADIYLNDFKDYTPQEMFSKADFSVVKDTPYTLTISPNGYYLFSLQKKSENYIEEAKALDINWQELNEADKRDLLESDILVSYIKKNFSLQENLTLQSIDIIDSVNILKDPDTNLYMVKVDYIEDISEVYMVIISLEESIFTENIDTEAIIYKFTAGEKENILYDGLYDKRVRIKLMDLLMSKNSIETDKGSINLELKDDKIPDFSHLNSWLIKSSTNNHLANYDNKVFLKFYKKIEVATKPDIEMIDFLNSVDFESVPDLLGTITYSFNNTNYDLAILQSYVANEGSFWNYSFEQLEKYYETILNQKDIPEIDEAIGVFYLDLIEKLAKTTGKMQIAIANNTIKNDSFNSEPFTTAYQHSIYQTSRTKIKKGITNLKAKYGTFSEEAKLLAEQILENENFFLDFVKEILSKKLTGLRIRTHGEFNIKQILYTGKDFVIVDFEGTASALLTERKIKRYPLRDVASLLRSIYYVAYTSLYNHKSLVEEEKNKLEMAADLWYSKISKVFLDNYLKTVESSELDLNVDEEKDYLLDLFLIQKFFSSLEYELKQDSELYIVPLKGLINIMQKWKAIE